MKKYFLLMLCIYSINSFSQHSLGGKVIDNNNKVISGVEIYLPQIHKGTVTNIDGEYQFLNIPKGIYKINVLHLEFEPISTEVDISKNTYKNFILNESIFEIGEIIISTPFNKLQSHNVMKVESIKLDNQTIGSTNLTEKLTKIAGISTIGTGIGIGKPVIRGLSGNRVLVYNQGVRFENFQFGEKHGLGINEKGISRVEVIKGPASLLYGSDALGGVIYLVPEKFERFNNSSANISSSFQTNTLGLNSSVGVKTSKEKFKFLARASYNTQSDYIAGNNLIVSNSRFNNIDFKTGVGFDTRKIQTDFRYNYNQAFNGIPHEIDEQSRSKKVSGLFQQLNNHILSVKNNVIFNSLALKTNFGFTHHNRNLFKNDSKKIEMNLNTFNYDIKAHLKKLGEIETIVGVQGMYQTNTNNGVKIFLPNANTFDFGAFVTSNYEFGKNTIQAGLRFDNRHIKTNEHGIEGEDGYFKAIDRKLNNGTGAFGIKSELSKNVTSRVNLSLGFRAPNLSELTSNGFHQGRFELGNNNLKSENNFQVDINLEYGNKTMEFFINGFYNKINNYIYLSPSNQTIDGFDVFTYHQNNSILYGGESGFHFHPVNHKWIHFTTSGEWVVGKNENGDYLPRIPSFGIKNNLKFNFKVNQKFNKNYFVINNRTVFEQNNISQFETVGEAYSLFDVGLGSNFKIGKTKTDFSIKINNLLNKNFIDHLSVLKEDNIPNIGRNIIIGFDIKI